MRGNHSFAPPSLVGFLLLSPAACAAGHILPPLHSANPEFCFSVASEFEFSRALFGTCGPIHVAAGCRAASSTHAFSEGLGRRRGSLPKVGE